MKISRHHPSPEPFPFAALLLRRIFRFAFVLCGGIANHQLAQIPESGPVIFCPNHISDCDPAAVFLTCPRRDIYFMAKSELFNIPILGPMLTAFGTFKVQRGTADRAALRVAENHLKVGNGLVIFGEGRVSENGKLQPIKPGIALIALHTRAPIIPVGLARTNLVMPYGAITPRRSTRNVRVVYGQPITMDKYRGMKSRDAIPLITGEIERSLQLLSSGNQTAPSGSL